MVCFVILMFVIFRVVFLVSWLVKDIIYVWFDDFFWIFVIKLILMLVVLKVFKIFWFVMIVLIEKYIDKFFMSIGFVVLF